MERKRNVLFLCTHNSCRSQMAEAFLRKYAGDRFNVFSAGLEPTEIDPMTREVMHEVGLDLEGQSVQGREDVSWQAPGELPHHRMRDG